MQTINTIISSKFETIGTRICEGCGNEIPIIRVITPNRDEQISKCLNCDNKKLEEKYQEEFEYLENSKHLSFFKKYSMIPDDLRDARFSNYKPDEPSKHEAKRVAMSYVKDFKAISNKELNYHSLLIHGSYGLGKSHLAYSVVKEISNKGYKVIFIDVPQLLQLFRENIKSNDVNEKTIMQVISSCDLLVLDDLGAEYIKNESGKESWAVDKLFQIFSLRNNKPKIITTNLSAKELQTKYGNHGGRLISRMMMGTKAIKMTGEDFRLKGIL